MLSSIEAYEPNEQEIALATARIRSRWTDSEREARAISLEAATQRLVKHINGVSEYEKIPVRRCRACGVGFTKNRALSLHLLSSEDCHDYYLEEGHIAVPSGLQIIDGTMFILSTGTKEKPEYTTYGVTATRRKVEIKVFRAQFDAVKWIKKYDPKFL